MPSVISTACTKPQAPPRLWMSPGPERHSLIVGGRLAVVVALSGQSGRGKRMVLDVSTWDRVKLILGEDWLWKRNCFGGGYVVSERKQAVAHAGGRPILILARYIALARPEDLVTYRDGDTLNLTRGNLEIVDRKQLSARAFGTGERAVSRHVGI